MWNLGVEVTTQFVNYLWATFAFDLIHESLESLITTQDTVFC